MSGWQLVLALDRDRELPVFVQIARAIADDVRRGRLRPGDPLPGSRTLATALDVHRNTVLAAYDELTAEGWLTSSPARGTFVTREIPETPPRKFAKAATAREAVPERPGYELSPGPEPFSAMPYPPGTLVLAGGIPDVRLAPAAALARAYRRALKRRARVLLNYREAEGEARLRRALAEMLKATRGLATEEDDVFVTRGSQQALFLVSRALLAPGDVVLVEALGYRPAWEAFRAQNARLIPVPIDENGVDVDELQRIAAKERVRAIYVTPHHQYPTTVTLAPGRRLALLELARKKGIAIIEDDYDHEFHYDGRPVLPLASVDRAGVVIYVGTLSKVLAPGLRLGYVVAPHPLLERLRAHRAVVDLHGDHVLESALAELFEDGEVQRHIRRARRIYRTRREVLEEALREELGDALAFARPTGGLALWCKTKRGIDPEAWAKRALERGVAVQVGRRFAFDGKSKPHLRLGFSASNDAELKEAAKKLARALEDY